jgi:hypothetical protein
VADVEKRVVTTVRITAETIGDVAKWLTALEDCPGSTPLVEPVTLVVEQADKP